VRFGGWMTMRAVPGEGVPFVCSWSGGKDSCLAFYRAVQAGAKPAFLLSILREDGARSRSHGLALDVLEAQAASLGISLVTRTASWSEYESVFIAALQELKGAGVQAGVFGDIDLEDHRLWEEKVCAVAGIEAYLPLWKTPRLTLLDEFLASGFKAMIVAANNEKLGKSYLGRTLDRDLVREFGQIGIDPSGEEGEYHTIVTDGPIFSEPARLETGKQKLHDGYWFLDVMICDS
jgi:diphthine-ammonia ligase